MRDTAAARLVCGCRDKIYAKDCFAAAILRTAKCRLLTVDCMDDCRTCMIAHSAGVLEGVTADIQSCDAATAMVLATILQQLHASFNGG